MLINSVTLLFLIVVQSSGLAKSLFQVHDIVYANRLNSYRIEDLNNDGLKDLLVVTSDADSTMSNRWLSIYLQNRDGFADAPVQTFRIDSNVIVFDIGNVAGDEKKEFVTLNAGTIEYYALSDTGFTLSQIPIATVQSIFMLPDNRSSINFDFVRDLNNDQVDELFVPGLTKATVYERDVRTDKWRNYTLPLRAESHLSGFYNKRFSVGARAVAAYTTPYIALENFNTDGHADLLAVYRDSLVVFCQADDGRFSRSCHHNIPLHFGRIWNGSKIQRSRIGEESVRNSLMRILDLDGDGLLDVVAVRISTEESFLNPNNEIRIHYGQLDSTNSREHFKFSEIPNQIIKPGGTQLVLDILDLNGDKKFDLLTPVVKVGLRNIIRMMLTSSVEISAETYLMSREDVYPEKPDRKVRLVVNFGSRGGAASPVYEIADFNADGFPDILSSHTDQLLFFWGKAGDVFESSIGARYNVYLPQDGERVMTTDLNGDGKADIIIDYAESNPRRKKLRNLLRILLRN